MQSCDHNATYKSLGFEIAYFWPSFRKESEIRGILTKSGVSRRVAGNLINGVFTPVNYSKKRFDTKVDTIETKFWFSFFALFADFRILDKPVPPPKKTTTFLLSRIIFLEN